MPADSPSPFIVPFHRPRLFGRDALLKQLHDRLSKGAGVVAVTPVAALTGQGGIGKTQLAALYVHEHREDWPGGIFWLDMGSGDPENILGQVAESFAPKLKVTTEQTEPKARRRELAAGWLAAVRNDPTVLVVADNLEEPRLLESLGGLANSRLTTLDCKVLVTSRRRDLRGCASVDVEVLSPEAATELLLSTAGREGEQVDAPEADAVAAIARRVGFLPLALKLAGSLARIEESSFREMVADLADCGIVELVDDRDDDWRKDVDRALSTLLDESLKALPPDRRDLLDILKTVALLPEGATISVEILRLFVNPAAGRLSGRDRLQDDLNGLHNRSLLERPGGAKDLVRLHPLIRERVLLTVDETFRKAALDRAMGKILTPEFLFGEVNAIIATARVVQSIGSVEKASPLAAAFTLAVERKLHILSKKIRTLEFKYMLRLF
jgi:hypothetical protein